MSSIDLINSSALATKQAEFLRMEDGYQVGAVVDSHWGYGQTNVDFYLIVKRTKTMVTLRPVRSACIEVAPMVYRAVPTSTPKQTGVDFDVAWRKAGCPTDITRKLKVTEGKTEGLRVVYGYARLWSGKPVTVTKYN